MSHSLKFNNYVHDQLKINDFFHDLNETVQNAMQKSAQKRLNFDTYWTDTFRTKEPHKTLSNQAVYESF